MMVFHGRAATFFGKQLLDGGGDGEEMIVWFERPGIMAFRMCDADSKKAGAAYTSAETRKKREKKKREQHATVSRRCC